MAQIVSTEVEALKKEEVWSLVSPEKVVVLFSGGLDSSTLLYKLCKEGYSCYPISFNYGQVHSRELISSRDIVRILNLPHTLVDLASLGSLLVSALTGKGDIPDGHYTDKVMSKTIVPNRNMILLSVAAGYALSVGASQVAYAAHSGDHPIYPDCRPEFIRSMEKAIVLGTDGKVLLSTPFSYLSKSDIVSIGSKLGVPFRLTWSCYKGGVLHCGTCGTCVERKEAFRLANVEDPTRYLV